MTMVNIIVNGTPNDVKRCSWVIIRNGQSIGPFGDSDKAADFCRDWFTTGIAEVCPMVSPRRCNEALEQMLGPKEGA